LTPEHDCPTRLVLDTNVVLDLLVFADPAARPLAAALALRRVEWLATASMREELDCVLGYPQIMARLALASRAPGDVLQSFDRQVRIVAAPARACVTCSDPDDQKFIDLAVSHRCALLTKDGAVLKLKRKLAALQVSVFAVMPPAFSYSLIGA
jgi:putative PIN family toxin of toxin-antitoxin system